MKNYATQCEKIRFHLYVIIIIMSASVILHCLLIVEWLEIAQKKKREINVDHTFLTDACLVFDLK